MSQYAQILDLQQQGINPAAIGGPTAPTDQQLNAGLTAASGFADDYLGNRYKLPLQAPYPPSLVMWVCQMAAWFVMKVRGFNPEGDPTVRKGFEDGRAWLRDVSNGDATPYGVVDSSGSSQIPEVPEVYSNCPRGW